MAPQNGDCNANIPLWLHRMEIATPTSVVSAPPKFSLSIPLLSSSFRFLQLLLSYASGLQRGQTFSETESGHGLRSSSSSVWSISASHVTVRAAEGDDVLAVQEGEGEEKGLARSLQSLGLVSEADLLRKKAKKARLRRKRLRRKRLVRKRQLRKKGRWPPSKLATNKNAI